MAEPGDLPELRIVDEIDSTSAALVALANSGEPGPLWLLAHRQTAGRGRRGRAWRAVTGNFTASLLSRHDEPPATLALRSFVVALALYQALVACGVPEAELSLKWPNDVLLKGRKLAGILLETAGEGALVIGIGVNIASAPQADAIESGALPPIALAELLETPPTPEALLSQLARAYDRASAVFMAQGFGPIREAWLAHAHGRGHTLTARMASRTVTGVFETLDADGALVLSTGVGHERITAGDLYFA